MGAIRMLSANDLRRRWLSTLAITLLVGIVGAIVIAAVAGARRSDSSLRRFNDASRSANLELDVGTPTPAQVRAFLAEARVPRVGVIRVFGMTAVQRPNVSFATDADGTWGTVVDRPRLIAGRLADPNAADEATIGEAFAKQTGLHLGSVIDTVTLTPEQVTRGSFDPVDSNPRPRLRIVGIVRRPSELSDLSAGGGIVSLTRGFTRAYADKIVTFTLVLRVEVPGGAADIARVRAVGERMFGSSDAFRVLDPTQENTGAQSAIDVLTTATWIFAIVAAIAGLFAIGIVVFREISRARPQQAMLRSMGLTRGNRVAVNAPRGIVLAAGGAFISVAGAIALSPLFPFGVARRADPDIGVHADWFALGLGAFALFAFVLLVVLAAAVRTASLEAHRSDTRRSRSIADAIAVSRLSPTIANGVRLAFDPGRDERAVPLRSAFAGAVLGVLGVTAVLVFAASLTHLADTPKLYGWTWDVKAHDPGSPTRCDRKTAAIDQVRGVTDLAAICYASSDVNRRNTVLWSFTPLRGSIGPTIVAGRAPAADDEVALGLDTLDALHRHVGDSVKIDAGKPEQEFHVVGRVVFPPMVAADAQHLADGAVVTSAGFARVHAEDTDQSGATTRFVVARLAPGVSVASTERGILALPKFDEAAKLHPEIVTEALGGPTRPPEIDRLRNAAWFAPALAILMCALALIAVAHALITAARRRRHELAVLKAIGFDRGQVRASLAWEATTLALVGLVVGIPAGVIAGRLAWAAVAGNIGIAATIVVPLVELAIVVPATILLVNVVAFFPARSAARTRTAVALAAE